MAAAVEANDPPATIMSQSTTSSGSSGKREAVADGTANAAAAAAEAVSKRVAIFQSVEVNFNNPVLKKSSDESDDEGRRSESFEYIRAVHLLTAY